VRYEIDVNGRATQVVVVRRENRLLVSVGDIECVVDAATAGAQMLSLLVERSGAPSGAGVVESREIAIARDPVTGQLTLGIGAIAVPVHLNPRRRWGQNEHGSDGGGPQRLTAPMPGKVVRVAAHPGERVSERQPVVVIEAMKMENELRAARDGVVSQVLVQVGQSVEAGALLAVITPS
jgi:biotin carboxyl carrier protein